MPGIDVLDRQLEALELVFTLNRVRAGARHRSANIHVSPDEPVG